MSVVISRGSWVDITQRQPWVHVWRVKAPISRAVRLDARSLVATCAFWPHGCEERGVRIFKAARGYAEHWHVSICVQTVLHSPIPCFCGRSCPNVAVCRLLGRYNKEISITQRTIIFTREFLLQRFPQAAGDFTHLGIKTSQKSIAPRMETLHTKAREFQEFSKGSKESHRHPLITSMSDYANSYNTHQKIIWILYAKYDKSSSR